MDAYASNGIIVIRHIGQIEYIEMGRVRAIPMARLQFKET